MIFFTRETVEWATVTGFDEEGTPIINDSSWDVDTTSSGRSWLQCEWGHKWLEDTGYAIK